MAEKDPETSVSSHSAARLQVFEFQVDTGAASRVPSAKSFQESLRSYSSSKIGGLAGLQPVLGRWNDDERDTMNDYLLRRIRGKTGTDADADENPPDSFREYLEEMLKTPKKLEEFVLKGTGVQYDSKNIEAKLRDLADEAIKAADDEGRRRLVASREMLQHKAGDGSGFRLGQPDMSSPTGIHLGQSSQSSVQGSDIYVVGVQLMKLKDLATDQSALNRPIQTPEQSGASSQKPSGRGLKFPGKDVGSWSPVSSEILIHDEDLRGSTGPTTPADWTDVGFRTTDYFRNIADVASGRDAWKPAKESKRETAAAGDLVGQEFTGSRGHDAYVSSRPDTEDAEGTVKQMKGRIVASEAATGLESDDGKGQSLVAGPPQRYETLSSGAKAKKKPSSKKRRPNSSDAVQDSRKPFEDSEKLHQIQTLAEPKRADQEPLSQPTDEQDNSLKPSPAPPRPSSVPQPAARAEEISERRRVAPQRQLKTKLPGTFPTRKVPGEPDSAPSSNADPAVTPEMVKLPVKELALPDSKDHTVESSSASPAQPEEKRQMSPVAQEESPAQAPVQPQDQQPLPQQPILVRQTLQDDIFFGFYFTRAFVFSYFRTKPSHYSPDRSVALLKSDVLDSNQRRLLRDIVENPSRYRCIKDLRAVERMQALAKTAERNSIATSPVSRLLHRLPNLLSNA